MNHTATSREELLNASLKFAAAQGIQSINIRDVARECHVSVGCVYRYFPSKAELVSAAVARIWERIFHLTERSGEPEDFRACVCRIFGCIRSGSAEYPAFFREHAAAFSGAEKNEGRRVMDQYLGHIRAGMLAALRADPAVCAEAFGGDFTQEAFIGFVFENLLLLGMRQAPDCDFLLRLIEKLLYPAA